MKRWLHALAAGAVLIALCGCSNASETETLTLVAGMAVDGEAGAYHVITEAAAASGTEESVRSVLLNSEGSSLFENMDQSIRLAGRDLYYKHARVLAVGRDTAEAGLAELLDGLLQDNDFQLSLRLAVTKSDAAEVFRAKTVVQDIQSLELENMVYAGSEKGYNPDMALFQFYNEVKEPGIEGILPFVELTERDGEQTRRVSGTALFRDDKMIGVLGCDESQPLLWMRGKRGGAVEAPGFYADVSKLNCRITADKSGAVIQLHASVSVSCGNWSEQQVRSFAQAELQRRCQETLAYLQAQQCDAVGVGAAFQRQHKKVWDSIKDVWPQIFETYPVTVKAEIDQVSWGRTWSPAQQSHHDAKQEG